MVRPTHTHRVSAWPACVIEGLVCTCARGGPQPPPTPTHTHRVSAWPTCVIEGLVCTCVVRCTGWTPAPPHTHTPTHPQSISVAHVCHRGAGLHVRGTVHGVDPSPPTHPHTHRVSACPTCVIEGLACTCVVRCAGWTPAPPPHTHTPTEYQRVPRVS